MTPETAVIGGTGLDAVPGFEIDTRFDVQTPFGAPSEALATGRLDGQPVIFLPRHGADHRAAPHLINYRANLWALRSAGVRSVVAVAAVGGISDSATAPSLHIPDQVIDYTYGREHTFSGYLGEAVTHVDFTRPYCDRLRGLLSRAADVAGIGCVPTGTYGATQGPRLESAAEILRLERDGCDLVGMTGMPEAALARELGLCYATIALVVNRAAGKDAGPITMGIIGRNIAAGMDRVIRLIAAALPSINAGSPCPEHSPVDVLR